MRSEFWNYYPPTDEVFDRISKKAIVAVDASALLHAYRLPPDVSDAWLALLEELQDRLWIPYQAAHEYQRNRVRVVAGQAGLVPALRGIVESGFKEVSEKLNKRRADMDRSRIVDGAELMAALGRGLEVVEASLAAGAEEGVDPLDAGAGRDTIDRRICDLTAGRIGEPLSHEDEVALFQEGKARYAARIPPGWADADKASEESAKFGDLLVWKQLIARCLQQKQPAVLVTEDVKPDWWRKDGGQTLGPLPALRKEFYGAVSEHFWLYTISRFMQQASHFGATSVSTRVVDDAAAWEEAPPALAQDPSHDPYRLSRIVDALKILADADVDRQVRLDQTTSLLGTLLEQELGITDG